MVDSATDAPSPPAGIIKSPLRNGRTWTVALWAMVLSLFVAGADQALQEVRRGAEDLVLLLLPEESLTEIERNEMLAEVRASPVVKSARWISPEALAKEASRLIPRDLRRGLLDPQTSTISPGILPWIAEVRFESPLDRADQVEKEIPKFKALTGVRWIAWDAPKLQGETKVLQKIQRSSIILGALVFAAGIATLLFQHPGENAFGVAWLATVALSLGLCVAALLGLSWAGWATGARSWGLALCAGFLLAGAVDPVLKNFTVEKNAEKTGS